MSVLIKGMEMPPTCRLCKFGFYDWRMYLCDINDEIKIEKSDYFTCRHPDCPLVDVSEESEVIINKTLQIIAMKKLMAEIESEADT